MLINPEKCLVIREDPLGAGISLDKLGADLSFEKEIDKCDYGLHRAFAWFANRGHIEPVGWYESHELTFDINKKTYYYGNER